MSKFLYVFNKEDKETLFASGFRLLLSDEKKDVYVFLNSDELKFDLSTVNAIPSDILTF